VSSHQDYIERLQEAVARMHDCGALWRETVSVREVVDGGTVWQGEVEVFNLRGHPNAKCAYAWSPGTESPDSSEQFVVMLEIPPVISPETAVKMANAVWSPPLSDRPERPPDNRFPDSG
jgi:hypothetical protein